MTSAKYRMNERKLSLVNFVHVTQYIGGQKCHLTGFSPKCPLFKHVLSFYGITKWALNYLTPILIVFKKSNRLVQDLIFGLCTELFLYTYYLYYLCKRRACLGFCFPPIFPNLHFYISKYLTVFRGISL